MVCRVVEKALIRVAVIECLNVSPWVGCKSLRVKCAELVLLGRGEHIPRYNLLGRVPVVLSSNALSELESEGLIVRSRSSSGHLLSIARGPKWCGVTDAGVDHGKAVPF